MSFVVRTASIAAIAGAALLGSTATSAAQPAPPNCSLADMSGVLSGVSAAMSAYLFTHPDVNTSLSGMKDMTKEERGEYMDSYMSTNPTVQAELQGIRQPLVDFRARCGMEPVNMVGAG